MGSSSRLTLLLPPLTIGEAIVWTPHILNIPNSSWREMKMKDYDMVWQFLREFFSYEHYPIAIERIRRIKNTDPTYQKKWEQIKFIIQNQQLPLGEPLNLLHNAANQVLDENCDREAYSWLKKMISNVERTDGVIDEY
jgi:hypothetical protein